MKRERVTKIIQSSTQSSTQGSTQGVKERNQKTKSAESLSQSPLNLARDRWRISLSAKIIAPMIALICIFTISTLYSTQRLNETLSELSAVRSSLSSLPSSLSEIKRDGEVLLSLLNRHARTAQPQLKRGVTLRFAALNARLSESQIRLEALSLPRQIISARREGRALHAQYIQLESQVLAALNQSEIDSTLSLRGLITTWKQWLSDAQSLIKHLGEICEQEERRQISIEREALYSALMFTALSLILGLALVAYISRLIKPLHTLTRGVHSLIEGDYSHRVELSGSYELVQLAAALNRMGEAVEQRDAQLVSEQRQRLQETSLAAAGRLSAQITHELRNPLSSIGLNSELLAEELQELGVEEGRERELQSLLSDISHEVERLRGITEQYLRYARIPPPELQRFNPNQLCSDVLEFYRAEAERSLVHLVLDPDPVTRDTLADPNQLRSALLNLIRNACEALEGSEGMILITVRTGSGEARISVQDSGSGIPEGIHERIFEPFFSTKPQGTGLGLSMVQQLMRAQGGRVTLERGERISPSNRSTRTMSAAGARTLNGALFVLYLPLAPLKPYSSHPTLSPR